MALGLDIRVDGMEAVGTAMARVAQAFKDDLGELWAEIEPWWYGVVDDHFSAEASPLMGDWPELGALADGGPPGRYGKWKAAHYPDAPLLELDGRLRDEVTGQGPTSFADQDVKSLTIGSYLPYWSVHQHGTPGKHIPQRAFAGVSEAYLQDLDEVLQQVLWRWNAEWNNAMGGPGGVAR